MANLIKIKRSSATAAPTTLNEGELAVSFLSGKLFVGNSTAVIPIGGVHSPGTLTANQALVANATSGIDKVIVANLVPTFVYANGAFGTDGQVLSSNSTGGVFWSAPVSNLDSLTDVTLTATANNQLLVYDNTAGQWENHSISGTASQVNVAFTSQDITISLPADVIVNTTLTVGNSTVNSVINSTAVTTGTANVTGSITVGSNVSINTSAIFVGNSTVNTTIQAGNIALRGTQISIGPDLVIDGNTIIVGNSTVNTVINSSSISVDGEVTSGNTNITGFINVSSTANVGGDITARANVTVNGALLVANTANLGNTTVTGFVNATVTVSVGSNVVLDTASITIGNSTVNTFANSTSLSTGVATLANTTINGFANVSGNLNVNGNVVLGDSFGTDIVSFNASVNTEITPSANNTQQLGRADLRWGEVNANNVLATNVAVNSIVTVGSNVALSTSILSIGNSTVNTTINSTSVSTGGLSIANLTVSGDADLQGNTKLGNATTDVVSFIAQVNTNIIPSANLTYSLGNNSLYWAEVHTGNVHADYAYFQQDVAIYGDLTVAGNLVTTNVQSVIISDPLIQLAGNNNTSDLVDIGFVGHYHTGGANLHTGLFRDASVDEYYLFKGLTQELFGALTVNTADPTFALADLNAYLQSGGLTTNATHVAIVANSTVNVSITANSLSLSSALAVGSGGTGLNTVTTNGILYGNTTGPLGVTAAGTSGQVLQANSTGGPVFADLDGGTF